MPAWLSPFPIPNAIAAELQSLGWLEWQGPVDALPADGACLYDAPDQLLSQLDLPPAAMLAGYHQLLALPVAARAVALRRLLPNAAADPLAAALAQQALLQQPGLLDAYLDLELRADLLGDQPDTAYRQRLQSQLRIEPLLEAWRQLRDCSQLHTVIEGLRQELETARSGEQEAREEAELTLLQLHQVQEELEQVFLADRAKQQELEEQTGVAAECERLRQELETARSGEQEAREEAELTQLQLHQVQEELEQVFLADRAKQQELEEQTGVAAECERLRQELETARSGEQEAREEAELTLLQLHQVQEELEHYFLLARGQSQQIERYDALQQRSHRLLARLINPPAAVPAC